MNRVEPKHDGVLSPNSATRLTLKVAREPFRSPIARGSRFSGSHCPFGGSTGENEKIEQITLFR